jgi:hypothetical protein
VFAFEPFERWYSVAAGNRFEHPSVWYLDYLTEGPDGWQWNIVWNYGEIGFITESGNFTALRLERDESTIVSD